MCTRTHVPGHGVWLCGWLSWILEASLETAIAPVLCERRTRINKSHTIFGELVLPRGRWVVSLCEVRCGAREDRHPRLRRLFFFVMTPLTGRGPNGPAWVVVRCWVALPAIFPPQYTAAVVGRFPRGGPGGNPHLPHPKRVTRCWLGMVGGVVGLGTDAAHNLLKSLCMFWGMGSAFVLSSYTPFNAP